MGHLSLTRRVTFSAAHRYRRPDWSDAKNREVFGEALTEFHGHAYVCDVTVSGPIDDTTGRIVDLGILDRVLHSDVVERFDHGTLNTDIPEFADGKQIPTGENLATLIAGLVQRALDGRGVAVLVTQVTVAEDPALSATWRAPGAHEL